MKLRFLFFVLMALTGCRPEPIITYQVPKETSAPAVAAHREVDWTVPAAWEEQSAKDMRVGSFLITSKSGEKADVSVIPLAGDAGGDAANINRWRGQIGLGPLSESDLQHAIKTLSYEGKKFRWIEFSNNKKHVIAAIHTAQKQTWFFKMTGDETVTKESKPAFVQFLKSLHFHDHP